MRLLITCKSRSGSTLFQGILNHHPDCKIEMEKFIYRADREMEGNIMKKPSLMRALPLEKQLEAERRILGNTNNYKVFGDKKNCTFILNKIVKPFKVIYLIRDGRDVVSSEKRRSSSRWAIAGKSVKNLSKDWAFEVNYWLENRHKYDQLTIKFEDLIHEPEKTWSYVAGFLGISYEPLIKEHHAVITAKGNRNGYHKSVKQSGDSHVGYYKQWVPGWKEEFHPSAIEILHRMEYI